MLVCSASSSHKIIYQCEQIDKNKTKQERQEYKNNLIKSIIENPRININLTEYNIELNNKYINENGFKLNVNPNESKSIIIKSAMGTGKTNLILDLLKSNHFKSVLYVSSWITFTHFICNKLNIELNKDGYDFIKYNDPWLSGTKINSFDNPYVVC